MTSKGEKQSIFRKEKTASLRLSWILIHINRPKQRLLLSIGFLLLFLFISYEPAFCQFYDLTPPISYYYTNPLFFTDFGYINSIIEPFYYLGYGYKPPIEGNTLLAWNRYTPFHDAYSAYLFNFLEIPTYAFFGSPYQMPFPYQTLPGTEYPYARFQYPTYSYGAVSAYQGWLLIQ